MESSPRQVRLARPFHFASSCDRLPIIDTLGSGLRFFIGSLDRKATPIAIDEMGEVDQC
jgi:hypothetical protein